MTRKPAHPISVPALCAWLSVLSLLPGCRKDLCYDHDEHGYAVRTYVVVDWEIEWERSYETDWESVWPATWPPYESLLPDTPDGVRAIVYKEGGGQSEYNIPAEGGRIYMDEGTNQLLFYNNDTEYIVFNDLLSSASATATTRTRTRGGFKELHGEERSIAPPDMLFSAFIEDYEARKSYTNTEIPVTMRPLTYTYLVRYEFSAGQQYVALARGALAGMAESVYLQDGHTGSSAATILYDCSMEDFGAVALVPSFGVPDHPGDFYGGTRAARTYSLNLDVKLTNGKMMSFDFDVTDQVSRQPRGGVIIVRDIAITPEDAGGGGFDVDVDGWGEYQDVEMPPLS